MAYDLYNKELKDAIFNGQSEKLQKINQMVFETLQKGELVLLIREDQKDDLNFEHFDNLADYQAYCTSISNSRFFKS